MYRLASAHIVAKHTHIPNCMYSMQVERVYLGEPEHVIRKRSLMQPIRIHQHYDNETMATLNVLELVFLQVNAPKLRQCQSFC